MFIRSCRVILDLDYDKKSAFLSGFQVSRGFSVIVKFSTLNYGCKSYAAELTKTVTHRMCFNQRLYGWYRRFPIARPRAVSGSRLLMAKHASAHINVLPH